MTWCALILELLDVWQLRLCIRYLRAKLRAMRGHR